MDRRQVELETTHAVVDGLFAISDVQHDIQHSFIFLHRSATVQHCIRTSQCCCKWIGPISEIENTGLLREVQSADCGMLALNDGYVCQVNTTEEDWGVELSSFSDQPDLDDDLDNALGDELDSDLGDVSIENFEDAAFDTCTDNYAFELDEGLVDTGVIESLDCQFTESVSYTHQTIT